MRPKSGEDNETGKGSAALPEHKARVMEHIPFTHAWFERRKSRQENLKEGEPNSAAINSARDRTVKKPIELAEPGMRSDKQRVKSLAQYPHHDNKGAVDWKQPARSPDRPYPYRQYVGGKRVLAVYSHNQEKWAVKHRVY